MKVVKVPNQLKSLISKIPATQKPAAKKLAEDTFDIHYSAGLADNMDQVRSDGELQDLAWQAAAAEVQYYFCS